MAASSFRALSLFLIMTLLTAARALTYHCADFSSLPVVEAAGVTYKDSGTTTKFETILFNHGTNMARIRVWTAGAYDLTVALATAKRAYAAGMKLYIDLHYSDTCKSQIAVKGRCRVRMKLTFPCIVGADPSDQSIPSGWPTTLAGLDTQIYTYAF